MPCDSGYGDPQREFNDRMERYEQQRYGNYGPPGSSTTVVHAVDEKMKGELDYVARLLCDACDVLDSCGINYGEELRAWKTRHDAEDYARQKHAEQIRSKAALAAIARRLSKQLTPIEKEALMKHGVNAS